MTAKKIWAHKFYHDSQEIHKNSQRDISWTSSDSEGEERYVRKKIKTDNSKRWIKAPFTNGSKSSDLSQICISNETVTLLDTPAFRMSNFEESPIISSVSQEEMSPVLVENCNVDVSNETSPVIGKRGILKKVRSKLKRMKKVKQNIFPTREASPDIFSSQPSQLIENCSPDQALCKTMITISQSSECLEPASSPQSSQITKHTSETSSSTTDNSSLYHRPVKKRKRYQKGGLAALLQKTLRLQKTRISRWQHEVYTNKSDNIQDLSEEETVIFIIRKFYKEYGNTVLEAELLDEHKCSVESDLFQSLNGETTQFILVLISPFINVTLIEGEKYQIFPPYCSKIVLHKSKNVVCYYGVSKIMVSKR